MNLNQAIELIDALKNVNGATFITIDTVTVPTISRTIPGVYPKTPNPFYGAVEKRQLNSSVMVFQNKRIHGYANMVERRLVQEGKDPTTFELSARRWGKRIPNMPLVLHNGAYYLEVIFLRPGRVEYTHNGQVISKDQIIGLTESTPAHQGGLDNKVQLRVFSFDSLRRISINGQEMHF